MPVPLIAALVMAASALAGGKGVYDTVNASKRIKKSKENYLHRREKYEKAEKKYKRSQKNAERKFKLLGKIRLDALANLGKAVKFIKKAKIKERELREKFEITPQKLKKWEMASINALEVIGGMTGAGISGVSTATAVYGLVGVLGTASTGTAISTLSGAAATNATLAWLGGGSLAVGGGGMALGTFVLGGIVVGPAILVAGFFAKGKAQEIETKVAKNMAEMDVAETQIKNQLSILKVILSRVNELKMTTIKVNSKLSELLEISNPDDIKEVYQVARTAKALGDLLDVAILDKDGELIQ